MHETPADHRALIRAVAIGITFNRGQQGLAADVAQAFLHAHGPGHRCLDAAARFRVAGEGAVVLLRLLAGILLFQIGNATQPFKGLQHTDGGACVVARRLDVFQRQGVGL